MERKDITSIYYDKCIYQFRDTRLDKPIIKWSILIDQTKDYLTIEALEDDLTVSFSRNTIQYSIDNCQTWNELPADTPTPAINTGDKISFKATGLNPDLVKGIGTFVVNKNFNLKGNIMSMLFGDEGKNSFDLTGYDYAFTMLFYDCTTLQSVSKDFLPATILTEECYYEMFRDCTSLVNAPELPATTLTKSCYSMMFRACSSLVSAPELPATTLAMSCYAGMFNDCTSLVTAPELLATELKTWCYMSMFQNCISLVSAPELPATTLVVGCYSYMFYGCSSLNYIKALFTEIFISNDPMSDYTESWVSGVSSTGTFVKNKNATWNVTGVHGIPSGWTVQTI